MADERSRSRDAWRRVVAHNLDVELTLGPIHTEYLLTDPKRFGFVLARYKFAAKMLKGCRRILEIGCGEGVGALTLLAETPAHVTGIDFDPDQIDYAGSRLVPTVTRVRPEWQGRLDFQCRDMSAEPFAERFDGLLSIDVIEHVDPAEEDRFLCHCRDALDERGVAVFGTPNDYASPYASKKSQIGHINMFTPDRLEAALGRYFSRVLMFSMNDEMVHTGFAKMAHYLMAVCIR